MGCSSCQQNNHVAPVVVNNTSAQTFCDCACGCSEPVCPTPQPCTEITDSNCIIYTDTAIKCGNDTVVPQNTYASVALNQIVDYFCSQQGLVTTADILCGDVVIVPAGTDVQGAFELVVAFICNIELTPGPAGADGTNGTNGTDGATGPQGPQGIQGIPGQNNPIYKVYTALLTQTSTAPVAIVLDNTIGNIVWSKTSTGSYLATLNGAFPDADKVAIFINQAGLIPLGGGDSVYTYTYVNNSDSIILDTLISSNYQDGQLYKTTIEIRVYN